MTPQDILQACRASGVIIGMDAEGGLSVKGPPADIARLVPALRAHKPDLLALLAGKRAEPAPLPTRWRTIHRSGVVRELDAPSGLSEAEARELAERLYGPVASLAPVSAEPQRTSYQTPTDRKIAPDPNAVAVELAREHGISAAAALAILDDGDKAAIRAGDPAMIEAWKSAVALVGKVGPLPEPEPEPVLCRDCRYWMADRINPIQGLGSCAANSRVLPWPGNSCPKGFGK